MFHSSLICTHLHTIEGSFRLGASIYGPTDHGGDHQAELDRFWTCDRYWLDSRVVAESTNPSTDRDNIPEGHCRSAGTTDIL